jgi:hypothetical protein
MLRAATCLIALAVLVAGCAETGTKTALSPTTSEAAQGTHITGTVTSADLAPIQNALVQLDAATPILTDAAGAFDLPVESGPHKVTVQAIGFQSVAKNVTAVDGETLEIKFVLDPLEVRTPRVETLIYDGYDICTYATPTNVGTVSPCPIGEPKNANDFDLPDAWRYFVLEMTWSTSNSFWVSINAPGGGCLSSAPCPGVEIDPSPLRMDGAPMSESIAKRYAMDGKKMYAAGAQKLRASTQYAGEGREALNSTLSSQCGAVYGGAGVSPRLGCPLGVGFSTGIRFTQYVSIFHWEGPADVSKFTALPPA